jgi:hypothetical protein
MAEDITKPDTVQNHHEDDAGTGIYWFIGQDERYEQVFIPRIKRRRAVELATDFDSPGRQKLEAYRWVPVYVETPESLVGRACGGKCERDIDCVDNSCHCIRGRCRRK